jgi:hypothetical protein
MCRCALCHKEQEAGEFGEVSLQRGLGLTPDAATNRGLGPLLLVKVSAIANAWVHSQCAVWSPEVPPCPLPSKMLFSGNVLHRHRRSTPYIRLVGLGMLLKIY